MPSFNLTSPKIIHSGLYWEVIRPNKLGYTMPLEPPPEREEVQTINNRRKRQRFIRSVNSNAGKWYWKNRIPHHPIFMVGTFDRQINVADAKRKIALFQKRINYQIYGSKKGILKCHTSVEFTKKGNPHVNVIMYNLPFVPHFYTTFSQIWGYGRIRIQKTKGIEDTGSYCAKYFSKDFHTTAIGKNKRLYSSSKYLIKPTVYRGEDARFFIQELERTTQPLFMMRTRQIVYAKYKTGEPLTRSAEEIPSLLSNVPVQKIISSSWIMGGFSNHSKKNYWKLFYKPPPLSGANMASKLKVEEDLDRFSRYKADEYIETSGD